VAVEGVIGVLSGTAIDGEGTGARSGALGAVSVGVEDGDWVGEGLGTSGVGVLGLADDGSDTELGAELEVGADGTDEGD
jgi:hypothetical protein